MGDMGWKRGHPRPPTPMLGAAYPLFQRHAIIGMDMDRERWHTEEEKSVEEFGRDGKEGTISRRQVDERSGAC